jgi:hypothetical protein
VVEFILAKEGKKTFTRVNTLKAIKEMKNYQLPTPSRPLAEQRSGRTCYPPK